MNRRRSADSADSGERKARSPFIRGEAGRKRGEQELKKQKERKDRGHDPFRFFVKEDNTTEFIILDDQPDFFIYEHGMKHPRTGKWTEHAVCIDEWDNCPVCEAVGDPAYVMMLTVIDLTEYVTKDKQRVTWSRKLLPVKTGQQKKFMRVFEREGSLRGACFETSRDNRKEAAIGGDIQFLEFEDERELKKYVRKWKDRDGKQQTEDCSVPFNYEEVFTVPTRDELLIKLGQEPENGGATPGSRREAERSLRDDDDDGWEDDDRKEDWDEDEEEKPRSRRGRRGRDDEEEEKPRSRRGRSRRDEADDDDEPPFDTDEGEEEEKPRSRRGRERSKSSGDEEEKPRSRRGRRGRDDEDEDEDEDVDEKPARRGRRSRR